MVSGVKGGILDSDRRHVHLRSRLRSRLLDAVNILMTEMERSQFRPAALELEFGPDASLPGISLRLDDGERVYLRGQIDRVDLAESTASQRKLVRVWDYKLGQTKLALDDVADGISLQLLAYCLVLVENGLGSHRLKPASVQYFRVAEGFLSSSSGPIGAREQDQLWEKQYAVSGLFGSDPEVLAALDQFLSVRPMYPIRIKQNGDVYSQDRAKVLSDDEWTVLLAFVRQLMGRFAQEILSGRAGATPHRRGNQKACERCDYENVCHFDPAVVGHSYRVCSPMPSKDKKKYLLEWVSESGGVISV